MYSTVYNTLLCWCARWAEIVEDRRQKWREDAYLKRWQRKDQGENCCVQMACSGPKGCHNSGISSSKRWCEMDHWYQTLSRLLSVSFDRHHFGHNARYKMQITLLPDCAGFHLLHFSFSALSRPNLAILFSPFHSFQSPPVMISRHLKQTLEATLLACSNMQMDLIC